MKIKISRSITARHLGLGLTGLLLGMIASAPASAQYYPPYGGPPPGYERDYYRPRPQYRQEYRPEYRQRRNLGTVCVTSRGSCGIDAPNYIGAPCRCDIPGFGRKRGNVQY